jgi:amino-acid N-acetyltransferase
LNPTDTAVEVRAAEPHDVSAMVELMAPFIATGDLLPKTPIDLLRELQSYVVAVAQEQIVGSGSLRQFTPQLAEVQALAVSVDFQGAGIGRRVVEALLATAGRLGIREVFALTRRTDFFERMHFQLVEKERFPDKIWLDCAKCPRQDACDEVAVRRLITI